MSAENKGVLYNYFQTARKSTYSKGEVILDAEQRSDVYYIESGYVKVYAINSQGDLYTHIIYKSGEIFPVMWTFNDSNQNVFYEAVTETVVRHTSKEKFLTFAKGSVEAAYALVVQVSEQFYVYTCRVDNLEYRSARERVVYRLLFLASRFGTKQRDGVHIDVPLTHELLASTVNLVRESVSRELEKLEKKQLISYQNRHILIRDVNGLNNELTDPLDLSMWRSSY